MKNRLFLSIGLAALAVACTNQDVEQIEVTPNVTFTSTINSQVTRVTGSLFDNGDIIGVYADEGLYTYATNVPYTFANGTFSSSSCIQYREVDQELEFTAIYPRYDGISLDESFYMTLATDQSSIESYTASDFLVAKTGSTSEACPELEFYHRMSAIEVNIVDTDDAATNVVVNAKNISSCNVSTDTYISATYATLTEMIPYQNSTYNYSVVVAPQTVSNVDALVTLNIGGVPYAWTPTYVVKLEAGYKYVVNVSIVGDVIDVQGEVMAWGEGGEIVGSTEDEVEEPDLTDPDALFFKVTELTSSSVQVAATPGSNVGNYVVGVTRDGAYEGYLGSDPELAAKEYLKLITNKGIDPTVANDVSIFNGAATFYLWDEINSFVVNTSYYLYMFALNAEGEVDTNFVITTTKITIPTEDNVWYGGTVGVEIASVSGADIYVNFTCDGYDGQYFIGEVKASTFRDTYNSDINALAEVYVPYEMQYYSAPVSPNTCYLVEEGDLTDVLLTNYYYANLSTEYVVYAVGVNSNGVICTDASYATVTTADDYVY